MSDAVIDPAEPAPDPAPAAVPHATGHGENGPLLKMAVGAIGVVFGDIGTSPLYALRDTFAGHHPLPLDSLHVFGIISLMFWSMMIIVTLKYVTVIMRADNKGEGGSLALLALINQNVSGKSWSAGIVLLGVFAHSMTLLMVCIALAVVYLIALALIQSALQSIFQAALYLYARDGQVPEGFHADALRDAMA